METSDAAEQRQPMIIAGHTLTVIATRICEGEWSLCVENIDRIRTQWCEFFDSADDALAAGRRALETEPVEEFISSEGFGYLS